MTNTKHIALMCVLIWFAMPACTRSQSKEKEPGTRIVIQIQMQESVNRQVRLQCRQVLNRLKELSFPHEKATITDPRTISLRGDFSVNQPKLRETLGKNLPDWQSHISNHEIRLKIKPDSEQKIRDQVVQATMRGISRRLKAQAIPNGLLRIGVDRLLLEIGSKDYGPQLRQILSPGGVLEFHLVADGPWDSEADALRYYPGGVPEKLEMLPSSARFGNGFYLLQAEPALTGQDVQESTPAKDEYGKPAIALAFMADAVVRLEQFTVQNIGKRLAILLDRRVEAVVTIMGPISRDCIIQGKFNQADVDNMVMLLQSALPAPLVFLAEKDVKSLLDDSDFPNWRQPSKTP